MYSILVITGLMIPAAKRYFSNIKIHKGSDMMKDFLIDKINDPQAYIGYKFLTIFLLHMQYIVLFLFLFLGHDKFNMF